MVNKNWLIGFLHDSVHTFSRTVAEERLASYRSDHPDLSDKEFIRRYLDYRLRERGVVYGTPLASEETITEHTEKGFHQRRAVFTALQQVQVELALEIGCQVAHCTEGLVQLDELLVCYALFCRDFDLAAELDQLVGNLPDGDEPPKLMKKLSRKVAGQLYKRTYLAGNPLLGLPMHNSFNYGDAKTFCRLAIAYFEAGGMDIPAFERIYQFQDHERKLLLQALVGLTQADRDIGVGSRKVMVEQIKSAGLPRDVRKELLGLLKEPGSALAVAAVVEDDRSRDFLLEQVLLGAMLDGHFSEREWDYIENLAGWLGVSTRELTEREAEVVAFYEKHQAYLDMFTVGTAVRSYRQRMLEKLQQAISENVGLIVEEVRAKGELGDLLYKASSGEKLSSREWKDLRGQMVDVIRSIPSLAIFTLPGGAVLLPLIFKVLPDGLKPRAFAERDRQRKADPENPPDEVI